MPSLDAAIRARLVLHDSGQETVPDLRCAYDCEATQAALLAVLDLHAAESDLGESVCAHCNGWSGATARYPCPTVRAIAEKLGVHGA